MPGEPLDLELPTETPLRRAAARAARPLLAWILRLDTIRALHAQAITRLRDAGAHTDTNAAARFAGAALRTLDVHPRYQTDDAGIPGSGALIVAANHPHGALDGLLLLDAIGRVRPDVRLLANHLLARVPELRDLCFFVDPFGGPGAVERNLSGLRAAHRWLRRGGALIIFPAGEVAHERALDGRMSDAPWRATLGRLALATGAPVMPAYIAGANSRLFRAAGRLHPRLRTALLARELLKRRGRPATVCFGPAGRLAAHTAVGDPTADAATAAVRARVEELHGALNGRTASGPGITAGAEAAPAAGGDRTCAPIAAAVPAGSLTADVDGLPASALLGTLGDLRVYCAEAAEIPHVLDEIARLREIAFRAAGEGTGRHRDRDGFDDHYLHLFAWHPVTSDIAGAYRLARADRVLRERGAGGLYTRTLFRYDERLFASLPPALELGRSFVRLEHQRNPAVLFLLWKGIAAWIARHPEYRVLFGAVSISSRYHDRTRQMLMAFLEQHHLDAQRAALVTALDPYPRLRTSLAGASLPATVDEADRMVAALEGAKMPVLLRHYLTLNARLLGFNRDAHFGDALDALMMVDLVDIDPRILRRYFGPAAAQSLLTFHHSRVTPDAA